MAGLIWIQTVKHSDGIPESLFRKQKNFKKSADDRKVWKIKVNARNEENFRVPKDFYSLSYACTIRIVPSSPSFDPNLPQSFEWYSKPWVRLFPMTF